jgi:hypothetical protein
MLHNIELLRAEVSEECSASIIGVTRIDELGTTLTHGISSQRALVASYC